MAKVKMKIAMIGLRGIPAKSGGVENVVEHLAPLLVKLGCDVTVYCRNPYCKERPAAFKGVKLRYLPAINTKRGETLSHSALSSIDSLSKKYDIVHYHAMANGIFSFLPRIIGKKTIVTLHGLDWQREKWGPLAKLFIKTSEKLTCLFPNKVISVSRKIKDYYKEKYNKDIVFISNGIDVIEPKPISSLKRFGLKKDNYILFLGRIVPEKEVHTLIEAFKKLKTSLKLVIAGDAAHTEAYLEKVKKLAGNDERILFTGPLYGDEKIEAFSSARFFVLPSTIEGMPIVLLEAMSFGTCPLVSNIKENLDVTEGLGFSFNTKDQEDLRKKMDFMIRNPAQIKKQGQLCKKLVKKEYRWDTVAKKTLSAYKEALDG
jgi:glycosyltransferase involved in cell wall biosynthesis